MSSYRREHFRQYVRIAGKSNVLVSWTPVSEKLHLQCIICDETLIAREPDDPQSIDNSVQDWVRMHAHAGHHPQWGDVTPSWGKPHVVYNGEKMVSETDAAKKIEALQKATWEQKEQAKKYLEEKEQSVAALNVELAKQWAEKEAAQAKVDALNNLLAQKAILEEQLKQINPEPPRALVTREGRRFR